LQNLLEIYCYSLVM